jgi:lysozyme
LSQIALDYAVSIDALIRANNISDPSTIYVGQELVIPGCGREERVEGPQRPAASEARPQQEWQIAEGERPADGNPRNGPAIRPSAEQAQARPQEPQVRQLTYTVQPGDMLSWIAQEYNVSEGELATYNGIDNANFIYTGQVLTIPN